MRDWQSRTQLPAGTIPPILGNDGQPRQGGLSLTVSIAALQLNSYELTEPETQAVAV